MLTFVLVVIAIATFLHVIRMRADRPDLFRLALLLGLGIPAQAVLGGVTVLTGLNPYLVGAHFVVSGVLVVFATVFLVRVYFGMRGNIRIVPKSILITTHVTSLFVAVTVVVGVLTTGSGPHAGDAETPRNGFNSELLQHLHSYPAYITFGLTMLLTVWASLLRTRRLRTWTLGLLAVEIAQIIVGVTQARLGLPELLVGIHMVLACILVAMTTAVVLSLRLPNDVSVSTGVRQPDLLQRV